MPPRSKAHPATRPLLILGAGRPRGRRVRERLIAEAERRAMMVATLKPGERLAAVDLVIEATHPDAVAVCAQAPIQALVAAVAAARDLPFSCVPAGPEDLLARDLGAAMDDPLEALALPAAGAERTIDLGEVNGIVFVNYVALGLRPPRPIVERRSARRGGTGRARAAVEPEGTDHVEGSAGAHASAPALLVCNNRFAIRGDGRLGPRGWPDRGLLEVESFGARERGRAFDPSEREQAERQSCARFALGVRGSIGADVDGEARVLAGPLRFRSLAGALRVRAPQQVAEPDSAVQPELAAPA